jgi:hypothetical protein
MKRQRPHHSTIPLAHPPQRGPIPHPPRRRKTPPPPPSRKVARTIDQSDSSLLDVLDNLLNQGVVLNADVILSLANVDLVYLRLSALLCAADQVLPDDRW